MVGMATTFGGADYATPHGGQPFHYWKKGFGFGHGRGPGNHVQDPGIPEALRFTPKGDRTFASTPFWRGRYEVGQASSFGIGDRPEYAKSAKDGSIAPDNYGDVSRALHSTRRNATRRGISLKPRYPTMEEKYRDLSWPKCGPGPAKYNTSGEAGKSSWTSPSRMPSWTCQPRGIITGDVRETLGKPGPSEYDTRCKPGTNSPVKHGTLYSISMKGRLKTKDIAGEASPGPARYNLKGQGGTMPMHGRPLDEYGLWAKISNVKVPKYQPPPGRRTSMEADDSGMSAEITGEPADSPHGMFRVDSSPL